MGVVLFLSPHLDDAVFSCAARILGETRAGARVVVATLFSRGSSGREATAAYRERRREDREALGRLGAEPLWLGLPDAPFRHRFYDGFGSIVFGTAPGDERWIAVAARRLRDLIADLRPARVYAPLGVGQHIDHRLTFAAAGLLPSLVLHYEDRPYCFVHHAVAGRLAQLGIDTDFCARTHWQSLLRAPYGRAYLPRGAERRACRALLDSGKRDPWKRFRRARSKNFVAMPADMAEIVGAIFTYASQTTDFLVSPRAFQRAASAYARQIDERGSGGYAERYWRLA